MGDVVVGFAGPSSSPTPTKIPRVQQPTNWWSHITALGGPDARTWPMAAAVANVTNVIAALANSTNTSKTNGTLPSAAAKTDPANDPITYINIIQVCVCCLVARLCQLLLRNSEVNSCTLAHQCWLRFAPDRWLMCAGACAAIPRYGCRVVRGTPK